jgi:hypothetical protein
MKVSEEMMKVRGWGTLERAFFQNEFSLMAAPRIRLDCGELGIRGELLA